MPNEIKTERLLLRQLSPDEARDLLEGRPVEGLPWESGYPTEGTLVAVDALVRAAAVGVDAGPFGLYQLLRLDDQHVVGDIGFYGRPDADGAVTLGYGLAPSARGRGYATEALRAVLEWALAQPRVRRVQADTTHANVASQRVMERAGMRLVGTDEQLRYYHWP
jgi:RimJ/RimL family protein N-acetyltransferase